jgi:Tfp pilus assembly protein PilX
MNTQWSDTKQSSRESGMVAIMVTMILMIVISLIVLGFAQISRRNQRQALDRQLSTQAFYAAETGINDAAELIKNAVAGGTAVPAKPDCASTGSGFYSTSPTLDASSSVSYTCLTVNPTPSTLAYNSIGTTGTVVPLLATSGTIASITLNWQSKDSSATPVASCPTGTATVFSAASAWNCGYGVLRFDLVPTAGSLSLAGLQSATMTAFVVPLASGGTGTANPITYTTGGGNSMLGVICSNSGCSLTVNGLTQGKYYLRVSSLYKDASLQITAVSGTGTAVSFQGAQALLDATGKAQDVLRRIQVRLPLSGSSANGMSDYAIQSSEAICKRFSVMDGYFQSDANTAVSGVGATTTNPLCQ